MHEQTQNVKELSRSVLETASLKQIRLVFGICFLGYNTLKWFFETTQTYDKPDFYLETTIKMTYFHL